MKKELVIALCILVVYTLISIRVVQVYPDWGEMEWTIFGNAQYVSWWQKGGVAASGLFIGSLIGLLEDRKTRLLMVTVGVWLGGFDIVMYWLTQDQYGVNSYIWNVCAAAVALIYIIIKLREK